MDLEKYDEAIQACDMILNIKAGRKGAENVQILEEKCIRAIVGGSLKMFQDALDRNDTAAIDSTRRTISRVHELLDRLISTSKTEPWMYETMAYFNEKVGSDEQVLENLMKEYRALQSVSGWERDDHQARKVCQVISHICHFYKHQEDVKVGLTKCKYLITTVVKKVRGSRVDSNNVPPEILRLEKLLEEIMSELSKL